MTVIGEPRSFHQKWNFIVEIDGFGSASFQTCSELSSEFAEIAHSEGGSMIPDKQPGRMTISDVTLARGATSDRTFYDWHRQVGDAAKNSGLISPEFKRNGTIVQHDRDGSTIRRWRFFGAWPKRFVAGDWDNDADENVVEQLVLTIDRFELVQ